MPLFIDIFQCETLLEQNESDIENWYWKYQNVKDLKDYLCADIVLKGKDVQCLNENFKGEKVSRKVKGETKTEL